MPRNTKGYNVLLCQVFNEGIYSIVPIRYEDRIKIMHWRNEQIYHLRQNKILTLEDQNYYFDNVIEKSFDSEKPNQILFSFLKEGNCIGYGGLVHINWQDKNAEISFIMDTELEKEHFQKYWSTFLLLIEDVAFNHLSLHKLSTYAFDLRPQLYPILESMDYKKEAVLKDQIHYQGVYRDVVIHSKIK